MRLTMVVHERRPQAGTVAERFRDGCLLRGIEIVDQEAEHVDAVIAIGGDGTVLRAARIALKSGAALLGVNVGRKGFLADVEPAGLPEALDVLASGTWRESARMTIRARMNGGETAVGINDVVVEKTGGHSIISIEVRVDGERFIDYHADGLVFATPTGSTAYNLSAGGPLMDPEVEALIMSPVAPHSLFSKSVILHPDAEIRCMVVADRPAGVSVDGRDLGTAHSGDMIFIERGSEQVRFIDVSGTSFPRRVKDKFHLNEDRRSVGG
ncbi:MAG TPA: NAD(+)/NADH kinase [Actinobacteria bacterium]|nr:NAD(+)/NADH kinase [Actinomycetota bacterium]